LKVSAALFQFLLATHAIRIFEGSFLKFFLLRFQTGRNFMHALLGQQGKNTFIP